MKIVKAFLFLLPLVLILACSEDEDKVDDVYPVIDLTASNAFPKNCDTLFRGETFIFKARFTDNVELGSFSIDVHHNFDHHSHTTEVEECELDPVKDPVNPWLLIQEFSIPSGKTSFMADEEVIVPADVDTGDYHFMIRLTDAEGWQTLRGFGIKVL